ncbi:hypothetical protein I5Q34_32415 [Streptomyces sp. AV19]|uniref:hypothetical protein n=1 Tax=Streptomyces sp. AV19 TaxID=2793068 RepID=UPI0018FECB0A|nr:hypothetical protein [Streptomyces sp. AV19]MBH1938910.1 hypothetical protein [Streptomyces sp. AV19]MDG4533614.1 hypothetical protein [Streptomyces sp. AV19]
MSGGLSGGTEDGAAQTQDAGSRAGSRLDDDPVIAKAKVIMADVLECTAAALRPDADLFDDLGADEESITNVATLLEMELDIYGLYEDVDYWATVDDVLASVREQASSA